MPTLAELIQSRTRPTWLYDADTFLMKGKGGFGKLRIRPATVEEQNIALTGAHRYCEEYSKGGGMENDPDFRNNVKVAYILFAICRDAETDLPAFPGGPRWMMQHLTTDEFAVLLNLYNDTLRISAPIDLDLTDEKIEATASILAHTSSDERLNEHLARFTREVLAEILIRTAVKLKDARDEIDGLRKGITTLKEADVAEPMRETKCTS